MNDDDVLIDPRVIEYQANRLQQLLTDVHHCCKERIFHEAKMFDLPAAELKCLMLFDGHKYLTGIEIAGKLEVAKSRATVVLDNLERKGLVQRTYDPNDARVKLTSLTPAGFRKVKEIEDYAFHLHQQLLAQIEPSQRSSVIGALEILRSSMKEMKTHMSQ